MDVKATLNPGQSGTKRLVELYGEQLVCVRYRYDQKTKKRLKTIELIIDECPWLEGLNSRNHHKPHHQHLGSVLVCIAFAKTELRSRAKDAGAQWRKDDKLWELNYGKAIQLGLEDRIRKFIPEDQLDF